MTASLEMDFESEESALFFKRLLSRHRRNSEPEYSFCRNSRICYADTPRDKIRCRCGETLTRTSDGGIQPAGLDWNWSGRGPNDLVRPGVKFHRTHVLCHEMLSQGTVVVRGESALQLGWHHYFEVKILTKLYGTDTMIGLCTDKFDSASLQEQYISALGSDSQSWGYSFHGRKQEAGVTEDYGKLFGKGSIVGVYVNMVTGTVEYFLNRASLGVAFSGLRALGMSSHQIYPAVCTTAAGTAFRLITARSVPDSLQLRATRTAVNRIPPKCLEFLPSPIIGLLSQYPWFEYQPSEALVSCRLLAPRQDNFVVTIPPAEPVDAGRRWSVTDLPWNVPSTRQDVNESMDSPIGLARSRLSSSPDSSFCDLTSAGVPSTSSHRRGSARPLLVATLSSGGGSPDPWERPLPLDLNRRRKLRVCRDEDLSDEDDSGQLQLGWTKAKDEKCKKESKVLKEQESSSIVKKPPRKRCVSSSKAGCLENLAGCPSEGSEAASKRIVKRRRVTTSSASSSQDTAGVAEGCMSKCIAVNEGAGCSSGVSSFGGAVSYDHVEEAVQKSDKSGESKDADESETVGTTSDGQFPYKKKAVSRNSSSCGLTTMKSATSDKSEPIDIKLMLDCVGELSSVATGDDLVKSGPSTSTVTRRRSASLRSSTTALPDFPEGELPVRLGGLESITEETASSALSSSPSKNDSKPVKEETISGVNSPILKKVTARRRSSSVTTKNTAALVKQEQVARKLDLADEQNFYLRDVDLAEHGPSTVNAKRRRSTSFRSVCTTRHEIQEVELPVQLGGLQSITEETSSSLLSSGVNPLVPKKPATRRRSSSACSGLNAKKTVTSEKYEQDRKLDSVSENGSGAMDKGMVELVPPTVNAKRRRFTNVRSMCATLPAVQEVELQDQPRGLESIVEETSLSAPSSWTSKYAGEPVEEEITSGGSPLFSKKMVTRRSLSFTSSKLTTNKTVVLEKHEKTDRKLDPVSKQISGVIGEGLVEPSSSTVTASRRRSARFRSLCTILPEIKETGRQDQLGGLDRIVEEASLSPSKITGKRGMETTTSGVNPPLSKKAVTSRRSSTACSGLTTNKTTTSEEHEQADRKLESVIEHSSTPFDEEIVEHGLSTVTAKRRRSTRVRSVSTTLSVVQDTGLQDRIGGLDSIVEETSLSSSLLPSKVDGKPRKSESTSGASPRFRKEAATIRRSSTASSRLTANRTTTSGRRRSVSSRSVCPALSVVQEAELPVQRGGLDFITEERSLSGLSSSLSKDPGEPVKEQITSFSNLLPSKEVVSRRRSSSASLGLTSQKTATSERREQVAVKLDVVSVQSFDAKNEHVVECGTSTLTARRRRSTRLMSRCSTFPAIQEAELQDQFGGFDHIVEETSSSVSTLPLSKVVEGFSANSFQSGRRSSSAGMMQTSSSGRFAQTGCSSYASDHDKGSVAAVAGKRRSLQPSARPTNVSSRSCRRYSSVVANSPAHASPNSDPSFDIQHR